MSRRSRLEFHRHYDYSSALARRRALLVQTDDGVPVPARHDGSSGYDLSCVGDVVLSAGKVTPIRTGIRVSIPDGHFGLVVPTMEMVERLGIIVLYGLYDESHRDEVIPLAVSLGQFQTILSGTVFATLVVAPHSAGGVRRVDRLPPAERGRSRGAR